MKKRENAAPKIFCRFFHPPPRSIIKEEEGSASFFLCFLVQSGVSLLKITQNAELTKKHAGNFFLNRAVEDRPALFQSRWCYLLHRFFYLM